MNLDFYQYLNEEQKHVLSGLSYLGKIKAIRNLCESNFLLFVYLLGYRDLGKFHLAEIERLQNCRFITNTPIRRIWLWSRGFFKTSLITEAHTVWLIVNNPNIRLLIVSYTLDIAKKPLGAIRNHFINNTSFREVFPDFCPKPNKEGKIEFGTTEAITILNRTRHSKEPTVMCAGVGTNITGLHFDWMKIDDLVNKDSVTNDTQIQASKDYYSLLRPLFDNPTIPREDVIGTIYHFNDLHCSLMKNESFEKSFIPAKDETSGEFIFFERLNQDGWDRLCGDPNINPYDIQRQWLLRPVDPKDAKFKSEWWKEYEQLPLGLTEYVLVDPSSTQKKKSDYTVIERWGIDSNGNEYLIEGIRDKLTVFQRIAKVVEVSKRCKRLYQVKYEALGGRHGDLETLQQEFLNNNMPVIPTETKATTSSKADRIEQRLVGRFHAGVVYIPTSLVYKSEFDGKTHDFVQEYKLEYLQFPNSEHDDILDCHSFLHEEQLAKGIKQKTVQEKGEMTADDWEKFYKEIDTLHFRNPFLSNRQVYNILRVRRFKEKLNKARR